MLEYRWLTGLDKVYPEKLPEETAFRYETLGNEPLSLQLAYRLQKEAAQPIYVRIKSELPVSMYAVDYLPVTYFTKGLEDHEGMLYPDVLRKKTVNPELEEIGYPWNQAGEGLRIEKGEELQLYALPDCWNSLWITVNEEGEKLKAGKYSLKIEIYSVRTHGKLAETERTVEILSPVLGEQKTLYTCWFHYDSLADALHEEVFTEKYERVLKSYLVHAARHGMNMLLTPAFTPPLDTPYQHHRRKAQLVNVKVEDGEYLFDFAKLKRFFRLAKECGITHFEHSHFFSQWGAKYAPSVYAEVDGEEKEIFGWETDAAGGEYGRFLRAYLKALLPVLKEEGLEKKILFHISDEPEENNMENYQRAYSQIADLLDGYMTGDALSDYALYERGMVKIPIVATHKIEDFKGKAPGYWCYYTGGQVEGGYSNRVIGLPAVRNRALGYQMYAYETKGFLHWGYNYWYDVLSHGFADPRIRVGGYNMHPGTCTFVYPDRDGCCIGSMREKVFYMGLCDQRALELLEQKKGRKTAMELLEKHFGSITFTNCPTSRDRMLAFRAELNQLLQ